MDLIRAEDKAAKNALRKLTADGFDNFVSRIGLNNQNSLSASTYTFNLITRNRIVLEAGYRGSWIVGRVVDCIAEDMTREGLELLSSDRDSVKLVERAMRRLQIWQSLCTLIKWGRLYGGALAVMLIDGQDVSTPLNLDTVTKGQFRGIVVFDRWMLNPVLSPVIDNGPDMGLPAIYQIVTSPRDYDPTVSTPIPMQNVHHSRCIRYTGIDLPFFQAITEQMWGESVLERLWDRLIAFDNATMSAASLIDMASLRTVGIDSLREILAAGGAAQAGLEAQFAAMREFQNNMGITLLDKNDEFKSTAYTFSGLSDMLLQFGQQLAGASDTPLVKLFGQSPAGLNSTGDSDIRLYYDGIRAQQEAKLRNPMETLLKVMWRSTVGTTPPDDLEFEFTPLWQQDPTDKTNNAKTTTETVLGAYEAGLVDAPTAMKELRALSGDTGVFANISEESITEAELEPPPLPGGDPDSEPAAEVKPEEAETDVVKNLDSKPKKTILSWLRGE